MRIALVCDYYLDYVGGAQSSIIQQARALEAAGHEVVLISSVRASRFRLVPHGRAVEVRPSWTVPGLVLPVVTSRPRLVQLIREQLIDLDVDVVHLQTEFGLAHAALRAARQCDLPVVHTVHTFYWQATGLWQSPIAPALRAALQLLVGTRIGRRGLASGAVDNVLRNLTLTLASRADVVISPSAHQAIDLRAAGVACPVVVIPNPTGGDRPPSAPPSAPPIAPPRIAWIARCEPEKRPLIFAAAVVAAQQRTSVPFDVEIVGGGSQLDAVTRALRGAPRVRLRGVLDHDEVIRTIDASSLVAVTSFGFDNQPMTVAEAASRGRGVLYCDPRLQEGLSTAGYLSSGPDADSLADAIVHLVESPDLIEQLSRDAIAAAHLFSPASFVADVIPVYEDATTRAKLRMHQTANMYTP